MKPTLRDRLVTLSLTIIVLAAIVVLTACATKPPCPVAQVHPIVDRTGAIWFLIDEPNIRVVQARFLGARAGDCVPGETWAELAKDGI